MIKNKKILITGCAGFIGSNLAESLVENNKITGLDNYLTGKKENMTDFFDHPNFTFIEGDICDPDTCEEAARNTDVIMHQAALGSVPRSIKNPIPTNEINVSGFLNMLIAAKENNIKRFVYASSSSVYGDHPDLPKTEDNIGKPLSPYAVSKYTNEVYAEVFSRLYGIETIGLRYFNVFGKRQDPDGPYAAVIPKFIKKLIKKEQPIIHGDGSQSRDFTYIDNVVRINQLAAITQNKNAINQVYNVAYGEQTNLNEMYQILIALLSGLSEDIKNIKPQFGPPRPGDIPHSLASISKAQNLLNYNPRYGIKKGLEKSIRWYWENLQ